MKAKCCFLIDATGSMSLWIEAAKTQTRKIVNDILELNPDTELEIGAVFYRDFYDTPRYDVIPFTKDIQEFEQAMIPVVASGGMDTCEDVAGGMLRVLDMDWADEKVRNLFLITDAPPHGRDWHTIDVSDDYQETGDELWDIVRRLVTYNIQLTILRFSDDVVKMIENMEKIYQEQKKHVKVVSLGNHQTPETMLHREVSRQVSESIRESQI